MTIMFDHRSPLVRSDWHSRPENRSTHFADTYDATTLMSLPNYVTWRITCLVQLQDFFDALSALVRNVLRFFVFSTPFPVD